MKKNESLFSDLNNNPFESDFVPNSNFNNHFVVIKDIYSN